MLGAVVVGINSPSDGLDIGASEGLLPGLATGCIASGTIIVGEEITAGATTEDGM